MFRVGRTVAAVLLPVLIVAGARRQQAGDPRATVLVYDYARTPLQVLAHAESVAKRIYDSIGVETVWLQCPTSPDQESQFPDCRLPVDSPRLVLRLLPRKNVEREQLDPAISGFSMLPGDGGFGNVANALAHRVEELARGDEGRQGVILGYLMAHEVGHLLLGADNHSATLGLMRNSWGREELARAGLGVLNFAPWEARQIRTRLREGAFTELAKTDKKSGRF